MRKGWEKERAKKWAREHGYKYGDVDIPETGDYIHLRQFDPEYNSARYRKIPFGHGISATVKFEGKRNPDIKGSTSYLLRLITDIAEDRGYSIDIIELKSYIDNLDDKEWNELVIHNYDEDFIVEKVKNYLIPRK